MERQYLDAAEHPPSFYTPYIDIELQFDPLQADPLLQKSLVLDDDDDSDNNHNTSVTDDLTDSDTYDRCFDKLGTMGASNDFVGGVQQQQKRKLWLTEEEDLEESSATSDTSGRFDDADEESDTEQHQTQEVVGDKIKKNKKDGEAAAAAVTQQETHSAKRGRSNGWPLQNEIAYDENGMKIDLRGRRSTPTPTTTPTKIGSKGKTGTKSGATDRPRASPVPVLRIRRSRFVEGSMNDRVSEKPPSIFFREDQPQNQDSNLSHTEKKNLEKRSSGIFRFGKAIASAFHPFGSRGASNNNKSEVWKGSQDGGGAKSQKEIMKQRQLKAEQAYAELKKSGYKGTGTDAFNSSNSIKTNKVDASIADETWKSIQEKMGYKLSEDSRVSQDDTLVAVPGIRKDAPTPLCAEKGVSKLKSFSDLRKRTSNLSIPAMRFRDASPMSSIPLSEQEDDQYLNAHRPMERRQSRKELNRQAKLMKRVSNLEDKLQRARRELREFVDEPSNDQQHIPTVPTICVDDEHNRKLGRGNLPTILSERLLDNDDVHASEVEAEAETDIAQRANTQKSAKWPPVDSLSRKRKSPIVVDAADANMLHDDAGVVPDSNNDDNHDVDIEDYDADCGKMDDNDNDNDNKSPRNTSAKRMRSKLRPPRDKRASSLTTKASQRLKAKQSSRNLRQAVKTANKSGSNVADKDEATVMPQLQEQVGNNASSAPAPTPGSVKKKNKGRTYYGDDGENVPPVPPVPQELLADGRSARIGTGTGAGMKAALKPRVPSKEFSWPEDIF